MNPTFKLVFEKIENKKTSYRLVFQSGKLAADFLPVYKIGRYKGEKYIQFMKTLQNPEEYPYSFYLGHVGENHKRLTGVKFTELAPNQTFGDSLNVGRKDAILIRFSDGWKKLEMFFFENMARQAQELFKRWISGDEISETCGADALPLKDKKAPEAES